MNYKKWAIGFGIFVIAVFVFIGTMNYVVDPFGYFAYRGGDYNTAKDGEVIESKYLRYFKAEHVKNFNDQYDAYVIGGSKAGAYQPDKLLELDGYRYYNMFAVAGSFQEYVANVKYLVENTDAKKILLNISGGEVRRFESEHIGDIYEMPALVAGESETLELIDFFLKDVTTSIGKVKDNLFNKEETTYSHRTKGERNLEKYYARMQKDPEAFSKKYVTNKLDKHLYTLFENSVKREFYDDNLNAIRTIKELCDTNGVELQVILAPAFIGEMSEHDNPYYWNYLNDIVSITDVWDFSGYNDINLNPYNYYNEGHFFYEVFDLMVDTMTGKRSYEGFGVYVTKENVYEHLQKRENDYNRLKKEYEETGTVQLGKYTDKSKIR